MFNEEEGEQETTITKCGCNAEEILLTYSD